MVEKQRRKAWLVAVRGTDIFTFPTALGASIFANECMKRGYDVAFSESV
jgi:hypothetical protein